ncbi:tumor necrosis factor receptor superfamily member 6 [Discoglossus pictus]
MKVTSILLLVLATNWSFVLSIENLQDTFRNKRSALELKLSQLKCTDENYLSESHCCKKCNKGEHKLTDCSKENPENTSCKPCTEGKDYMDSPNGYDECLRCGHCDSVKGEEVLEHCTTTQNTICKCMKNYYCKTGTEEASNGCRECLQCDICKRGIAEECTSTRNTVCKEPSYRARWPLALIILPILLLLFIVCIKCTTNNGSTDILPHITRPTENLPHHLEDIDLTDALLQEIAGIMEENHVLHCVRKIGINQATIEEVQSNNQGNLLEQKYALLKRWHDAHGKRGAFKDLIIILNKKGWRTVADEIIQQASKYG